MLSIVAFVLEITPLGKPKYSSYFAFSGKIGEKTDALAGPGDVVVQGGSRNQQREQKERVKPQGNRSELMEQQSLFPKENLPAAHTHAGHKPGVWKWDGFNRDTPRPKTRTIEEAGREARQRQGISPRRTGRPRRKNI
jgi:hypothetical protein